MEMSVRCGIRTTTSSKFPGQVLPSHEATGKSSVLQTMGGMDTVQEFYRFFRYPGMAHIDVGDSGTVAYRCECYDYLED
jgi:hypothetical protein